MAAKCTKCGNESNYNFALNIGLCNTCISARLEDLKAENEKYKTALERIRDLETECCPRCEGSGNLYADGKAHYMSESAPTILCDSCGGSGRILPEDAQQIAAKALKEK